MAASSFPRGSTIFFDSVCRDNTGTPIAPISANLYLSYKGTCGNPKKQTIAMTIIGTALSAQWDSSVAAACLLVWSIKAIGVNTIAQDGSVSITANDANPRT